MILVWCSLPCYSMQLLENMLRRHWLTVHQDFTSNSIKSAFCFSPCFPSHMWIPWISWRKVWQTTPCTCAVESWGLSIQGGYFKLKYSMRIYSAINSWQDSKLFSTNASLTPQLKELLISVFRLSRLHWHPFFFQEKVAFICVGGWSYILLWYLCIQFTRKSCIPEV